MFNLFKEEGRKEKKMEEVLTVESIECEGKLFNNNDYILTLLLLCKEENKIDTHRMNYCISTIKELMERTQDKVAMWYNLPLHQWVNNDYARFLISFLLTFYNPSINYTPKQEKEKRQQKRQMIKENINGRDIYKTINGNNNNDDDDEWNNMDIKEKREFYWESCNEMGIVFKYLHNKNESLKSYINEIWKDRHLLLKEVKKTIINKECKPITKREYNNNWNICDNFTIYQVLNLLYLQSRMLCTVKGNDIKFKNNILECFAKKDSSLLSKGLEINKILCEMILIFNSAKMQYITTHIDDEYTNRVNIGNEGEERIEENDVEDITSHSSVIEMGNEEDEGNNDIIEEINGVDIIDNNNIKNITKKPRTMKKRRV